MKWRMWKIQFVLWFSFPPENAWRLRLRPSAKPELLKDSWPNPFDVQPSGAGMDLVFEGLASGHLGRPPPFHPQDVSASQPRSSMLRKGARVVDEATVRTPIRFAPNAETSRHRDTCTCY